MLLVTGGGFFYTLAFSTEGDQMMTQALGKFGPINAAEFRAQTPQEIRHDRFRVLDLMLLDTPGKTANACWYRITIGIQTGPV